MVPQWLMVMVAYYWESVIDFNATRRKTNMLRQEVKFLDGIWNGAGW